MKAILAVNNLGYIGLNNGLPWHCKADFDHFKAHTKGCKLLVGWNTFRTLPPLKGREIILDSSEFGVDDVRDIDWCIGGKKTYEKYAFLFDELHISYINNNTLGDVMFPDLRNLNPKCKIIKYYFET